MFKSAWQALPVFQSLLIYINYHHEKSGQGLMLPTAAKGMFFLTAAGAMVNKGIE
ncbi:hypothetical protein [Desulfocicer vacuolatum]|uniref:hypothetical protein n=1 Tax=Desulfocicer vacuolatum TaxID=2298 RepID=UPI001BAFD00C|nr:hypothetical protein [Desulfocicer vacuolatum]